MKRLKLSTGILNSLISEGHIFYVACEESINRKNVLLKSFQTLSCAMEFLNTSSARKRNCLLMDLEVIKQGAAGNGVIAFYIEIPSKSGILS